MPEEVTVDDVEELYMESWKLGLKAVAIYRDNCKLGQPLSTGKNESKSSDPAEAVEKIGASFGNLFDESCHVVGHQEHLNSV